jgi:hypothetical protein
MFETNGTVTAATTTDGVTTGGPTDTTAPSAVCSATGTTTGCTLPDNTALAASYPIGIPTTTTAVSIYDAAGPAGATPGTGLGSVTIGSFGPEAGGAAITAPDPVGWWIHVPSDARAGTYTSTITLSVISGP